MTLPVDGSRSQLNVHLRGHLSPPHNELARAPLVPPLPQIPVAGRLRHFVQAWSAITSDPWVLDAVRGLKLDLVADPAQRTEPRELSLEEDRALAVRLEVDELMLKGAVTRVQECAHQFVSQIFTIPKKDSGKERPVVNLKALNGFVRYEHFKMEGLKLLPDLLQPDDWLVKLDLKDAYFVVPIHHDFRRLLRFRWSGQLFQFQCLPFGLSSAPRVFTKLMKVPMAILRSQGVRLIIYLDDLLIMASSAVEALEHLRRAIQLLHQLGFLINFKKSVLTPAQNISFLGFEVDSRAMEMRVPPEKIRKLRQECTKLLLQPRVTVRTLACLLGRLTSLSPGLLTAPLRYRHLQELKILALRESQSYEATVQWTPDARLDLQWWKERLSDWNGKSLVRPPCNLVVFSDASLDDWGAVCRDQQVGGRWTRAERSMHINALELTAAFLALQAFHRVALDRPLHVRLFVDNTTCQAYLNKMGGTHAPHLSQLACQVWEWCLERGITVQAEYIPSAENPADAPSRQGVDSSDWMLDPVVFRGLCQHFQVQPAIDLFASRTNAQLDSFVSWGPQPGALDVDALAISWADQCLYAFPPFALLPRVLHKVRQSPGCRVLLVAPVWDAQPWYPLLLHLLVACPVLLPGHPALLTSPLDQPHPMVLVGHLQLAGWLISPDPMRRQAFHQALLPSSWDHGGTPPTRPIRQHGQLGTVGVLNGGLIPFSRLCHKYCSF
ncbi:uncharacterized protein LOC135807202 [Sycon ciliatum]|uniref:uncharacterized protein LOC135807202 n=1 Tax=Sycon ciliatum TaxID=27933 RepID=UPI0031F6C514